jgi:hypothetical protein
VEYSSKVQHLDTCPHGRNQAVADPGNWVDENLTVAQVNNLIRQATARLDNPAPEPSAGQFHVPAIPPIPAIPAIPPLNFNHQQVPAPGPVFLGMLNPFNWMGGGGGAAAPR